MFFYLSIFSYLMIFVFLAALAWRDVKEYILPDYLNFSLAFAFTCFHIFTRGQMITPQSALWGAVVGGGMLFLVRTLANKFYRADSLGLGDVKLMAAAGLGLGFPNILMAISTGAFAGMLHGLFLAWRRQKTSGGAFSVADINVPAGLGLTIGIAVTIFYQFGFGFIKN